MCGVVIIGALSLVDACSTSSPPVNRGGECFLATDCAPGLVCVEQANKGRTCSDDLTRVAGQAPPEGGAGDARASDARASDARAADAAPTEQDATVPSSDAAGE
jgi:hypothetical protein